MSACSLCGEDHPEYNCPTVKAWVNGWVNTFLGPEPISAEDVMVLPPDFMTRDAVDPAQMSHPGQIILRELQARHLTQKDLARAIGCSRQYVNDLVRERRNISLTMALRLSDFFGTSADFWATLQFNYDLWLAKRRGDEQERDHRSPK